MVKLNMFEIGPVELEVNMACLAKTMGFIDFFPNHYSLWPCHANINFFLCTLRVHLVHGNKNKYEGESQYHVEEINQNSNESRF